MHSGGYLDRNLTNTSPARLGIVVALHGAAIAALMLAPAEMIPKPNWGTIEMYPVNDRPPPPPEKIPEKPQQHPQHTIDQPTIIVPADNPGTTFRPFNDGRDDGGIVNPPVTPITNPVSVDATFVNGARIQPDYPTALARQEIEGVVTVRVLIGTDGRVKEIHQVSATEPEFFKATERQALRQWRFKPATRDGIAIESWRQLTIRFKLEA